MTPNDPYVTFDPKLKRTLMKLGSVVLLTKFGRNRMKPLETVPFLKSVWKKKKKKKERRTRHDCGQRPQTLAVWCL